MADVSEKEKGSPKLPISRRRNILITSALPYVNNVPHLGNIIGCVLSADVFARYCRLRGYNVIYICGTDEYGTTTKMKAMEENCSPKEICDKYHAIHKEVYKWFGINFDEFGRTSSPQQTEVCQQIFHTLMENKWLSENTMQQGTCPTLNCNYESAWGDQCEKCGKLLNPTELLDPKCKVCKNTPRIRDTDHLFLELPLLREKLESYINGMSMAGSWSQNAIQATKACSCPHEKYKDKVFYVWFDAPIGYVSITAYYTADWERWWKDPENVELHQFIGKDNVPFHTVMFPSTLLGTGENWTMMKTISVTEYLNYESGKFSKSKGIGVFGNDAKDTNIPAEVWRYYLLTNRPKVSDTLFTWADLQAKLNSELLNNLGNFINRVLSFIAKPSGSGYDSTIPEVLDADSHLLTKTLAEKVSKHIEQYLDSMEKVKLKEGLKTAMSISGEGNAYLQESQFWKLYKEDPTSCAIVMKTSVGLVFLLASLLEPFMPSFSVEQLNISPEEKLTFCDEKGETDKAKRPWDLIPSGHAIGKPEPLFKELKDDEVELFRQRFSGSQADRKEKAEADAKKIAGQLKATKISEGNTKKKSSTTDTKAKATVADISVSRLDIRVGILFYVEEIDVGEESTRTVISGLVKYIPLEEMQDRKVCVLCNLKPASMRGIKSHAMVLAASNGDHTKLSLDASQCSVFCPLLDGNCTTCMNCLYIVELVEPPASAVVGEQVTFTGYTGEPDGVLNPKHKVWETVQPDLHMDAELVACYKDVPFTTSVGICKVSSIACGAIR
ncbi:Methionine--tRNA ligase protein [Dioscorea alata]|uniref:Methionine--tRNA ligase protein n=1 Tax=Dioscorea alata TaxID=55571 RepID=A0ACB7UXA5_DIOAL|nr:Methionine--tRNA ligase protein [Dioscorea alata]